MLFCMLRVKEIAMVEDRDVLDESQQVKHTQVLFSSLDGIINLKGDRMFGILKEVLEA